MNYHDIKRLSTALAALLFVLAAPGAQAQDDEPISHFTETGIEIDGDYLDDGLVDGEDWFPFYPPITDPIKKDDETLCGTSPAPKNDITNSFVANNFEYLYMGMERLANRGNTSFFFTFDITGDGPSTGDFIFVFCFGSGERVTDTYVLEWNEATGEFERDTTPPSVHFAVNHERILSPFGSLDRHGRPSTTIDAGKFAEARVTLADIEGFDVCAATNVTLEVQTKSSCSLSSQCKDTTGPIRFTFTSLDTELELSQPEGCEPVITATANALSPRSGATLSYTWFLNGEDITDRDPTWSTSDSITIALEEECGETEIRVAVDDGTCDDEETASIDVNRQPVAEIARADVGDCDGTLSYSAAASTDCNGSELSYAWDFDGDGVTDSTDESGSWVFASCGERTITLSVNDGDCDSDPVTEIVYVNEAPAAGLAISASDMHCLEIAFEVSSTDCDELQESDLYEESLSTEIDFGDGSDPVTESSGVHRYLECGTYLVSTTTTDASGCSDTLVREVTIDVVAEVD